MSYATRVPLVALAAFMVLRNVPPDRGVEGLGSWVREFPVSQGPHAADGFVRLPPARYFVVPPRSIDAAARMLRRRPVVALTWRKYRRLFPDAPPRGVGACRPYLVRALSRGWPAGQCTPYVMGDSVWVSCDVLTHKPVVKWDRTPLLLLLVRKPSRLFLTVGEYE
jgi:hypothetical protein